MRCESLSCSNCRSDEGPCVDCYRDGALIMNPDLAAARERWPRFSPVALESGFQSAHALPMRLRGAIIGALNLFRAETGYLDEQDVLAAQALADVATIAILQHRVGLQAHLVNEQLNEALNSRIVIEQAKGVIAERAGIGTDEAFQRLRHHARSNNLRLADLAREVASGALAVEDFGGARGGNTTTSPDVGSPAGEQLRERTRRVRPRGRALYSLSQLNSAGSPRHLVSLAGGTHMEFDRQLADLLSEFARTLVTDFPIQAILDHLVGRIVDVLPITAAGVTLIAPGATPRYVSASDEAAFRFEQLQSELGEGPCIAAYETGKAVAVPDLRTDDRFPSFAPRGSPKVSSRSSRSPCEAATVNWVRSTCIEMSLVRWTRVR